MDIIQETQQTNKKTFLGHVFSTSEEGKAEIFNVIQYSTMGVIPIVILNKLIQRFIPDADPEKSSIEILIEILLQLIVMFCGIVLVHRLITYFPTYSGFKYDNLVLTNVILGFLIIVLSIQTKMGIKVNILVDRIGELWNGPSQTDDKKANVRSNVRVSQPISQHAPSQADYLDHSGMQSGMFPPAPQSTVRQSTDGYDHMMRASASNEMAPGPMAANSLLGSSFGAF
jgi:hypothetical protein